MLLILSSNLTYLAHLGQTKSIKQSTLLAPDGPLRILDAQTVPASSDLYFPSAKSVSSSVQTINAFEIQAAVYTDSKINNVFVMISAARPKVRTKVNGAEPPLCCRTRRRAAANMFFYFFSQPYSVQPLPRASACEQA
ncbi:unnamed protein product [Prorocentrum cordatum]|uniref:Uncharacterized protein n=1 Tax=Prorocentrum cordatum TaxID=2364126 RepID=A0ABN9WJX0_9DINO|nr:unnamed protein product [Polarella glacialis]